MPEEDVRYCAGQNGAYACVRRRRCAHHAFDPDTQEWEAGAHFFSRRVVPAFEAKQPCPEWQEHQPPDR